MYSTTKNSNKSRFKNSNTKFQWLHQLHAFFSACVLALGIAQQWEQSNVTSVVTWEELKLLDTRELLNRTPWWYVQCFAGWLAEIHVLNSVTN